MIGPLVALALLKVASERTPAKAEVYSVCLWHRNAKGYVIADKVIASDLPGDIAAKLQKATAGSVLVQGPRPLVGEIITGRVLWSWYG